MDQAHGWDNEQRLTSVDKALTLYTHYYIKEAESTHQKIKDSDTICDRICV